MMWGLYKKWLNTDYVNCKVYWNVDMSLSVVVWLPATIRSTWQYYSQHAQLLTTDFRCKCLLCSLVTLAHLQLNLTCKYRLFAQLFFSVQHWSHISLLHGYRWQVCSNYSKSCWGKRSKLRWISDITGDVRAIRCYNHHGCLEVR